MVLGLLRFIRGLSCNRDGPCLVFDLGMKDGL